MLVISRRKGQRIAIGDEIELVVTELHRSSVKLGIRAPKGYAVLRGEVRDSIEEANRQAAETILEGVELGTSETETAKAPTNLLRVRQPAGDTTTEIEVTHSGPEIIVRRRPANGSPVAAERPEPKAP